VALGEGSTSDPSSAKRPDGTGSYLDRLGIGACRSRNVHPTITAGIRVIARIVDVGSRVVRMRASRNRRSAPLRDVRMMRGSVGVFRHEHVPDGSFPDVPRCGRRRHWRWVAGQAHPIGRNGCLRSHAVGGHERCLFSGVPRRPASISPRQAISAATPPTPQRWPPLLPLVPVAPVPPVDAAATVIATVALADAAP
jgi:hypothetical protein